MYCRNCGTENEKGAKFCLSCGKPLEENGSPLKKMVPPTGSVHKPGESTESSTAEADSAGNDAETLNLQAAVTNVKKLPKNMLVSAALAGVVLIGGGILMAGSSKTIDLNHYLTVEVDGYDGYGTAYANIDWNAIEKKYGSKLSFTKEAKMQYGQYLGMITPMEVLEDSVYVSVDNPSELSNDETVTYTWNIDEETLKYLDCKVKTKDGEKKVSGLDEVGKFDAFANLNVTFSGRDANGNVDLDYTGTDLNSYDFSCDQTSGLSNGDTVTVSLSDSNLEYYADTLGKVPKKMNQEYTVEGLEYYLNNISEVGADSLAQMQQQAVDVYHAKAAQDWGEGETLESLDYVGNYLLTSKKSQDNFLFLVYKATVRDSYTNDEGSSYNEAKDVYWYIRYEDLLVDADGNVNVDVTDYRTPGNRVRVDSGVNSGWWSTKTWDYYGYETLEDLYKDVVTANLDGYNHQDSVEAGQQNA